MRKTDRTTDSPSLQPVVMAEFRRLAGDSDYLGAAHGRPAYIYLRVSSDRQADEDRAGLPRQLENCAELARREGYRVHLENVYSDDHTGYVIPRPAIDRLCEAVLLPGRAADVVLVESPNRLGREVWIRRYFERHAFGSNEVSVHYFSPPPENETLDEFQGMGESLAMRESKARMADGTRRKALDGRITSKKRAYGYNFGGADGVARPNPGRDTHYIPHPTEAPVVEFIFRRIADGATLRSLAAELDATTPPPRNYKRWTTDMLRNSIVRNPLYRGEYVHNRLKSIEERRITPDGLSITKVTRFVERDRSEWIIVPVPALVDGGLWQAANAMLAKNKATSRRNAKREYLLTGLVRCARCGLAMVGWAKRQHRDGSPLIVYHCTARQNNRKPCGQGIVTTHILDDAVWRAALSVLLDPQPLIDALDAEENSGPNARILAQIAFLESEIERIGKEDDRLCRAYMAGGFDENEFATRRKVLKTQAGDHRAEIARLRETALTPEHYAEQRRLILAAAETARTAGIGVNAPFADRKRILRTLADRIIVDTKAQTFRIEGKIRGLFAYTSTGNILTASAA